MAHWPQYLSLITEATAIISSLLAKTNINRRSNLTSIALTKARTLQHLCITQAVFTGPKGSRAVFIDPNRFGSLHWSYVYNSMIGRTTLILAAAQNIPRTVGY